MSPVPRELDVRLRLINSRQFRSELRASAAEVRAFGTAGENASKRMIAAGRGLRSFGGSWTRHVSAPIAAGAIATAKFAGDFHAEMLLLHTQAQLSTGDVHRLTDEVLNMRNTTQGPMELSRALFHLASIGLSADESMAALRTTTNLASVGHADAEEAAGALSAAFQALGGLSLDSAHKIAFMNEIAGTLNATIGTGRLRMDELTHAMGSGILPVASAAGLRIQDVMGVLALLTDEGFDASSAMRLLRTSLSFITDPSDKARKALEELHIGAFDMSQALHSPRGLLKALTLLHSRMDQLPGGFKGVQAQQLLGDILPAGRGIPLRALLSQLDLYGTKLDLIDRKQGGFRESTRKTMETPWAKMRVAWADAQKAFVRLGDTFLPILTDLLNEFAALSRAFSKLDPQQRSTIAKLALVAIAIGPVTWALGVMATGFGRVIRVMVLTGKGIKWLIGWQRKLAVQSVATSALQKRNAAGQLLPIGRGTKFARMLQSNTKWTGGKMALWMGTALAAGIAGWEIGKWLRKNVPAVRTAGDWLGRTFYNALHNGVESEKQSKRTNIAMDAIGDSLRGLDKKLKAGRISMQKWRAERRRLINAMRQTTEKDKPKSTLDTLKDALTHPWRNPFRGYGGTTSHSGRWLVGEHGPEVVSLSAGSRVQPLAPGFAAAMGGAGSRDGGGEFHLYVDGKELTVAVERTSRRKANRR